MEAEHAPRLLPGLEGRQGDPRSLAAEGGPRDQEGCARTHNRVHIRHEHGCRQGGLTLDRRDSEGQLQQGAVAAVL